MKEKGRVKWFNPTKGYGFIVPDNGSGDVFIHLSAVNAAGKETLEDNQELEFEIKSEKGKNSATKITLL